MNTALDRIALLASADLSLAEVLLRGIPNDDPKGCFVDSVMARLRDGRAQLCEVHVDGQKVGITVFQIEIFKGGHREFISVATHCPRTAGLVYDLNDFLHRLARANRCQSIRLHTCRHGLVKTALASGYHTAEIVLRQHLAP